MSISGTSSGRVGNTDPVGMQTASTSQTVDSASSGPDGGANTLQSLLNLGSSFGTSIIQGQQQSAAYKQQLQLAQLKASSLTSPSAMIIIGIIAVVVLFAVVGKD